MAYYSQGNGFLYTGSSAYHQPQIYHGIPTPCNGPCQPPCPHQSNLQSINGTPQYGNPNPYQIQTVNNLYPTPSTNNQSPTPSTNNQYTHPTYYQYPNQSYNQNQLGYIPQPHTIVTERLPSYTQVPSASSSISPAANTRYLAFCKKVHELNACGDKEIGVVYMYCGGGAGYNLHPNTQEANERCWNRRWQPCRSKKVRSGTEFCSDACEASVRGWTCCQCRIFVFGKKDNAGMVKHKARDGSYHVFCSTCIPHSHTPTVTQNVGADQANVNNFNLNSNAANFVGNGTFPTVHFGF